jgi:hypothetical protein
MYIYTYIYAISIIIYSFVSRDKPQRIRDASRRRRRPLVSRPRTRPIASSTRRDPEEMWRISWGYHGDIMGIIWGYHGDIMGMYHHVRFQSRWWDFVAGITGDNMIVWAMATVALLVISWAYHQNFDSLFWNVGITTQWLFWLGRWWFTGEFRGTPCSEIQMIYTVDAPYQC